MASKLIMLSDTLPIVTHLKVAVCVRTNVQVFPTTERSAETTPFQSLDDMTNNDLLSTLVEPVVLTD